MKPQLLTTLPDGRLFGFLLTSTCSLTGAPNQGVQFDKQILTSEYYCDGVNAGDFNNDGQLDIVAGPYWYEGPDFGMARAFYEPFAWPTEPSPSDSMFSYVADFNQDGWDDILVLGRVHLHRAYWYENPQGESRHWRKHFVFHRIRGESPPFVDIDHDDQPELILHWEGQWGWLEPDWQRPEAPWTFRPVSEKGDWEQFYHGTGVADMNGDGRLDLLVNDGWWEQPDDPDAATWPWTEYRFSEEGGAQMFAYDVDADGDSDVITALDGHGWGLAWFERLDENSGRLFERRRIMGTREEESHFGVAFSQPHALALADINGDGALDIVTGKRRWAHGPTGDVEPNASPVNYWFELRRNIDGGANFVPHLIDDHSGLGVQITVTDINGDQRPDILTASKLGTFLFRNLP